MKCHIFHLSFLVNCNSHNCLKLSLKLFYVLQNKLCFKIVEQMLRQLYFKAMSAISRISIVAGKIHHSFSRPKLLYLMSYIVIMPMVKMDYTTLHLNGTRFNHCQRLTFLGKWLHLGEQNGKTKERRPGHHHNNWLLVWNFFISWDIMKL